MNIPLDVESLSERYGPVVLRRCRYLLKDEDEAMGVCQDLFVRIIEKRDRLDARYLSSLLYVTATNLCLNQIRDRNRHAVPTDDVQLQQIAWAEEPVRQSEARLEFWADMPVRIDNQIVPLSRRRQADLEFRRFCADAVGALAASSGVQRRQQYRHEKNRQS